MSSRFEEAYDQGQKASADATRAMAEIHQVVGELSNAILKKTNQAAEVVLMRLEANVLQQAIGSMFSAFRDQSEAIQANALVAFRKKDESGDLVKWSDIAKLADITISRNGYPVELRVSGSELIAHDKESLEAALITVISRADVVSRINRLLAVDPKALS